MFAWSDRNGDMKALNSKMGLWEFIKLETPAIAANFVASMGFVYMVDEWLDSDLIMGKVKTGFFVLGLTGSYFILKLRSASKAIVRRAQDVKSNIADFGTEEKPKG